MELKNTEIKRYDRYTRCNHFPLDQARCDACTFIMSDRPYYATSFTVSWSFVHVGKTRSFWCVLYSMLNITIDELQLFDRSWAYTPEVTVFGKKVKDSYLGVYSKFTGKI